jgi:hypothetical protein
VERRGRRDHRERRARLTLTAPTRSPERAASRALAYLRSKEPTASATGNAPSPMTPTRNQKSFPMVKL